MKNTLLKIITVLLFLIVPPINAQDFQGKAVYQTKAKVDVDLSDSGTPADRVKRIQEMMKSQLEKTFVLTFNKTASIYKEEEKLDQT